MTMHNVQSSSSSSSLVSSAANSQHSAIVSCSPTESSSPPATDAPRFAMAEAMQPPEKAATIADRLLFRLLLRAAKRFGSLKSASQSCRVSQDSASRTHHRQHDSALVCCAERLGVAGYFSEFERARGDRRTLPRHRSRQQPERDVAGQGGERRAWVVDLGVGEMQERRSDQRRQSLQHERPREPAAVLDTKVVTQTTGHETAKGERGHGDDRPRSVAVVTFGRALCTCPAGRRFSCPVVACRAGLCCRSASSSQLNRARRTMKPTQACVLSNASPLMMPVFTHASCARRKPAGRRDAEMTRRLSAIIELTPHPAAKAIVHARRGPLWSA